MIDLRTNYGGLELNSPIIAGSSGLTDNVKSLKEFEEYGAGAVVLKSLFEEEIIRDLDISAANMQQSDFIYPETVDFYDYFDGPKESTTSYLELIKEAKSELNIPIIASINCIDAKNWTYFPKNIQASGADAIELNIFNIPEDLNISSKQYEEVYFDIINEVLKNASIPVFIKLSYYSSGLASFFNNLSKTGIAGMVLFNRFYNPDIDIDKIEITSNAVLSNPTDIFQVLRWVAIMANKVECDIAASTGAHDAEGVIKMLLAGASAVQITSAFYKNGIPYLQNILNGIEKWMQNKGYDSIEKFKGILSQEKASNSAAYSRVQFMKYYRGFNQ